MGPHLRGAISISPSLEYLERAYDDAKYGEFSEHPYMDIIIPSMIDPGMAPPGKHVMSIFVQYAPYALNGGWNDAKREAFGDAVVKTLARYAPNIESLILHRQVLTPADIERITGLSEGNIFQGELALHQLFFLRPGAAVGALSNADPWLLAVRRGHASRRRHHGRIGAPGGARDLEGRRMTATFDAIVIGGGANGLVAACVLARGGLKTLVLEREDTLGGQGRAVEFAPGFRARAARHRSRMAAARGRARRRHRPRRRCARRTPRRRWRSATARA